MGVGAEIGASPRELPGPQAGSLALMSALLSVLVSLLGSISKEIMGPLKRSAFGVDEIMLPAFLFADVETPWETWVTRAAVQGSRTCSSAANPVKPCW